jgi:hypothetical protein
MNASLPRWHSMTEPPLRINGLDLFDSRIVEKLVEIYPCCPAADKIPRKLLILGGLLRNRAQTMLGKVEMLVSC